MRTDYQGFVFDNVQSLFDHLAPLRARGKTLVTTNGCFDLLHLGHIQYLCEAASFGDILVVGVNSDASVRKLKGSTRPVQTQGDRVAILAALKMVDASFVFDEDDPRGFLEVLKPDVHVKGGDYTRDIIERPVVESHGGRVQIVSLIPGHSTSGIIARLG